MRFNTFLKFPLRYKTEEKNETQHTGVINRRGIQVEDGDTVMRTVTTFCERPLPATIHPVSNKIESPAQSTGALLSKKYLKNPEKPFNSS